MCIKKDQKPRGFIPIIGSKLEENPKKVIFGYNKLIK